MEQLTVGSLFSGIGGLDLGLERAGMRVVWQCESDPYCRAVLARHWPGVPCYPDARALADAPSIGRDGRADDQGKQAPEGNGPALSCEVLCGGFPCQPVSQAGKQLRERDDRWLWPTFAAVIRRIRPRYVIVENVPGLLFGGMDTVLGELAQSGYDAEWESVPAASIGAPHLRYRVFIVAYPNGEQLRVGAKGLLGNGGKVMADAEQQQGGERRDPDQERRRSEEAKQAGLGSRQMAHADRGRRQQRHESVRGLSEPDQGNLRHSDGSGFSEQRWPEPIFPPLFTAERSGWWESEPNVGRVAHGVPSRVDRLRALGNAVVPQVAEWVGRQIVAYESERQEAAVEG